MQRAAVGGRATTVAWAEDGDADLGGLAEGGKEEGSGEELLAVVRFVVAEAKGEKYHDIGG